MLALITFFFAWNNQSFWMDECCMAMSAAQNTLTQVWEKVRDIGGSDTQMPCYLYLLHIWIKITGADTESLLRLYNIIWVMLAAWFLRKEPKVLVILLISPFFIYYANELRPYIMQIAVSCGFSMFLYKRSLGEYQSSVQGVGLLFFLCTTSLTSVVWAAAFFMAWIVLEGKNFWTAKSMKAIAYWLVPFLLLGSYYLYSLLIGARAATISSNGIVNLGASLYELLGLTGLGPGRSELRLCTQISDVLRRNDLFLALLAGLIVGITIIRGLYTWRKLSTKCILSALFTLTAFPAAVFIYSSAEMDFRFSGRHFAPILPLLCIVISLGLNWQKTYQRILSSALVLIWLTSDVYIRFDNTYARKDFRSAIAYCHSRKADGETVLLLCNSSGKEYYGWTDDRKPDNWKQCQTIVISHSPEYEEIVKLIEKSGDYRKRKLCPAFWVYESTHTKTENGNNLS